MNYKYGGFVQLSKAALEDGSDVPHEKISSEVVVTEPGFLYVYLSNESATPSEVFFDNFTVSVSESQLVQLIDYYPYGMVAGQWERTGEQLTRELFQGKTYEQLSQLADFHARHYDAALGRWHAVDPANQFASPYTGMGNNPVMGVDPDGRIFHVLIGAVIGGVVNLGVKAFQGKINSWGDGFAAFGIGAVGGAVTAATGGAIAGAAGLSMSTVAGGMVAGASGAAFGSPVQGIGNAMCFGDAYGGGQFLTDVLAGGVLGGVAGGVAGWIKNVRAAKTGAPRIDPWGFKSAGKGHNVVEWGELKLSRQQDGFDLNYANPSQNRPPIEGLEYLDEGVRTTPQPFGSIPLTFGKNSVGHLIKHRDVLGFSHITEQQAQKLVPQLRAATQEVYKQANPALTRIGQWHHHNNALMYISNGKMVVTEANGRFITMIGKTSNNWYVNARPYIKP